MSKPTATKEIETDVRFPAEADLAGTSLPAGDIELRRYLVVGVDLGSDQRYAEYFLAKGPKESEEMAHQEIEEMGGGLLIAAVILDGEIVA